MKILLLSDEFPPDGTGGDGAIVSNLARGYKERGHDVYVVAAAHSAVNAGHHTWEGIPVEKIYAPYHPRLHAWVSLYNPRSVRMVKKVLAEFKPDVVHVHGVNRFLSYYTIVLARKSGARVYLTAHDAMLYHYGKALDETYISGWSLFRLHKLAYNPIRNFLIKRILRHVSGVISVSESLARALRANDIRVTAVIHNGIDVNAWTVSDSAAIDFKKKYGIGNHAILFGGRLSGLKGAFVAVEALAKVLEKVPDAQLLVLGTQNEIAEKMLVRAREQGIDASIVFTGRISGAELRAAYNAATVIIVPSLYLDPFPTMNLEAFACRKPVVATKFGGSSEIVRDRVTGFIVDPNDTSMVADRIIELLENPVLSRSFGEAGRNVLEKDFTITQQVQKYLSLFTEVA